jgi:hypothetical protein
MTKNSLLFVFLLNTIFVHSAVYSQDTASSEIRHIAIFAPLYLDSVYDAGNNYRYGETFPKFISAGLEFIEGAELALDTLRSQGARFDVHIYDTYSKTTPLSKILQDEEFQNAELIIGHANPNETRMIASAALQRHIPFVNVNLPNDCNIKNNPDFVLLNSTLKTHCEGIYRFLQKNYATSSIIYFYNKNPMSDRLKNYFMDIEKNTASVPLHLHFVATPEAVDQKLLLANLDSTKQNVFIVGSLSENFSKSFCSNLAKLNKMYSMTIIGMPTWDNIDFTQADYSGLEIYYSTPFYNNPTDTLVKYIQQYFRTKFYSRPSDMVFRGYESTYHFGNLLRQYGPALGANLTEKKYRVLNDIEVEPVLLNKQNANLDYYENKKLYYIKKSDGNITAVY